MGSQIYYGKEFLQDQGWQGHIDYRWERQRIKALLDQLAFLTYQEEEVQQEYKISYYMDPDKEALSHIHTLIDEHQCCCSI